MRSHLIKTIAPLRGSQRCSLTLAACFGALVASCSPETNAPASPINVVLIVLDTLRADTVIDTEGRVDTPRLDALAADGIAFSRAFSLAPMTLPSHTSLFSSRSPHATGIALNHQQVPERLPLLAEWIAKRGYATSAVTSIATLGSQSGTYGLERGFDTYDLEYLGPLPDAPTTQARLLPEVRRLAAQAKPFFLFAHYSDPHLPYNVHDGSVNRTAKILLDEELVAEPTTSAMSLTEQKFALEPGTHVFELSSDFPFRYDAKLDFDPAKLQLVGFEPGDVVNSDRGAHTFLRIVTRWNNDTDSPQELKSTLWLGEEASHQEKLARYPGEVEFVDGYVGELLDELKRLKLYDDSLIIFTSDHGEALGEHNYWGHSLNLFDELVHVPLVVKLPKGHSGGRALQALAQSSVSHVDLVPTILDVLGLPALPGQMGHSLLRQTEGPRDPVFAATHLPEALDADGSGKRGEDLISLRDDKFKLIYTRTQDRFEMYDLVEDPGELTDVFNQHGKDRLEWQERLREAARSLAEVDFESVLDGASIDDQNRMGALGYGGSESEEAAEESPVVAPDSEEPQN